MNDFSSALNNFQAVQRKVSEKEKESIARARAGSRLSVSSFPREGLYKPRESAPGIFPSHHWPVHSAPSHGHQPPPVQSALCSWVCTEADLLSSSSYLFPTQDRLPESCVILQMLLEWTSCRLLGPIAKATLVLCVSGMCFG